MTAELNLFGKTGFQDLEIVPETKKEINKSKQDTFPLESEPETKGGETLTINEEKVGESNKLLKLGKPKKKSKAKRKMKYSGHEVFSFLLASAIIGLVIWFFVLKKSVVSSISEYLPRSFELYHQNSDD